MRNESKEIPYAGFWVRLAAYTLDMLFVSLLLLAVRIPHFFFFFCRPGSLLNRPVFFTKTGAYPLPAVFIMYYVFLLNSRKKNP